MDVEHFDEPVGEDELELFDHTQVKAVLFQDREGNVSVQTFGLSDEDRRYLFLNIFAHALTTF